MPFCFGNFYLSLYLVVLFLFSLVGVSRDKKINLRVPAWLNGRKTQINTSDASNRLWNT